MDIRVDINFISVFLVVLISIKLYAQNKSRDADLRYFWLTLVCCALLTIQDILEAFTAQDPSLRFWRTLLSVLGYVLRPMAALGLLMVVCPRESRTWKIWILWLVNLCVNLTAFFSPLAFSFDENYDFVRGPLGFVVFAVSFIYMLQILYNIWKRFYEGKTAERWILILCVIGCIAASVVDAFFGGVHLTEAILVSTVFLFIYLRSHDNFMDPLTSLRNRFAFYDDSERLKNDLTAVASLDMNGLKALNDTRGHAEGDRALTAIGSCLEKNSSRSVIPYRVGGDEFVVLYVNRNEEDVTRSLKNIKDDIESLGYSASAGYAMKEGEITLDDALREADQNMYREKAGYYRQKGRDRRCRNGM